MSLDKATVRRIARLARIRVAPEDEDRLAGELNGILAWIEQLSTVDVTGVEPMTSVVAMDLAMREDHVTVPGDPDAILANAPQKERGFFVVPKVVE